MDAIVPQESRHARLGENGLREALERGASVNGVQALVDYWYPRVADTFGRTDSDRFDLYRRYGLRRHSNAELLAAWEGEIGDRLGRLGLSVPGGAVPAR
jgi:1,2-phenylacetyl-CoA epoxidase catalytic subunit